MWSRQICAGEARPSTSGHPSGRQSDERLNAFAQWRKASSTSTPIATLGGFSAPEQPVEQLGIAGEAGAAVDAQRLVEARNQEEQPGAAGPGRRSGASRRACSRAHRGSRAAGRPARARSRPRRPSATRRSCPSFVGGRDENERRAGDEVPAVRVEPIDDLVRHRLHRRPVERRQLVVGGDDVGELRFRHDVDLLPQPVDRGARALVDREREHVRAVVVANHVERGLLLRDPAEVEVSVDDRLLARSRVGNDRAVGAEDAGAADPVRRRSRRRLPSRRGARSPPAGPPAGAALP